MPFDTPTVPRGMQPPRAQAGGFGRGYLKTAMLMAFLVALLAIGGQMYGGTQFLGVPGALPPANVRQNQQGAMTFMWHSHAERELTTNNIFIGGMALPLAADECSGNSRGSPLHPRWYTAQSCAAHSEDSRCNKQNS